MFAGMPSRNITKLDVPESYYHVYARGASRLPVFNEPADFEFFIGLFARYLSTEQKQNRLGIPYPHLAPSIQLIAFCLMRNHFHMLVHQVDAGAMTNLMRCIMTSYTGYFNFKYKRSGSLFESRYKASMIDSPIYLEHISRYIHLNPRYWRRYPYSSFNYYAKGKEPEWLSSGTILEMFSGRLEYVKFVAEYEGNKLALGEVKHLLANY